MQHYYEQPSYYKLFITSTIIDKHYDEMHKSMKFSCHFCYQDFLICIPIHVKINMAIIQAISTINAG